MERQVKPPDFWYQVNLTRVVIPALDAENEAVHHLAQAATGRQFVRRVLAKELAEVAALNLVPAELVKNQVAAHGRDVSDAGD